MTLLDSVLTELQTRKGSWPEIARATGLDYSWLTKLAQGRIPDPSVNKIQRLSDHFNGVAPPKPAAGSEEDKALAQ